MLYNQRLAKVDGPAYFLQRLQIAGDVTDQCEHTHRLELRPISCAAAPAHTHIWRHVGVWHRLSMGGSKWLCQYSAFRASEGLGRGQSGGRVSGNASMVGRGGDLPLPGI